MSGVEARVRPDPAAATLLACPFCGARYELPASLMGPAGARVRCPACDCEFVVAPDHAPATGARAPEPRPRSGADGERGRGIAGEVITALLERDGELVRVARDRGRLFAEWGPALLECFDEYRRRAGPEAGPAPFRAALRDQLGVELSPVGGPGEPAGPAAAT